MLVADGDRTGNGAIVVIPGPSLSLDITGEKDYGGKIVAM